VNPQRLADYERRLDDAMKANLEPRVSKATPRVCAKCKAVTRNYTRHSGFKSQFEGMTLCNLPCEEDERRADDIERQLKYGDGKRG
jgi:hypothetical protein